MGKRISVVAYGAIAYLGFVAVFVYMIGFLANAVVPKGVDDGTAGPAWVAIVIDAALLGIFAVQHSVMARPWFKRWWTARLVSPAVERSTFVLAANLAIVLLIVAWRPIPEAVWSVPGGAARVLLWALYLAGWVTILVSTMQIGHFDLFGVRQVLARARRRPYTEPGFRRPLLYRLVRHPLMVGFLIAFWATPQMSVGRLLFALAGTGYILVGVRFEEHDLRRQLGEPYVRYSEQVPRFIPRPRARAGERTH